MIAAKTMGANVVSQNNKSCTGGGATKKRTGPCALTHGLHPPPQAHPPTPYPNQQADAQPQAMQKRNHSASTTASKGCAPMIRYLTLALALAAAARALGEMQGNLPTPAQKSPAYPQAVCVAANWATVPCASRALRPPAVKCLRPDGTEEPCETRQATPPLTTPVAKGAIIIPSMFEGVPTIQVLGEIVSGDETKLKAAIKDLGFPSEGLVYLNSIGGDLEASLAIANIVWARRYHTMVGTKAVCASMCGLIWLAGSTRWVFATSHIGFHSPYFSDKRIS